MARSQFRLQTGAVRTLALWHNMVKRRDLSSLPGIVHPDAIFRSPMVQTLYESAAAVIVILNNAMAVFEDSACHREHVSADGYSVVVEF